MAGSRAQLHGPLHAIEVASCDEIRALQLTRLRSVLQRVYTRVPHYRRAFDAAGAHPDDCRQLADLARFPFTTKSDLRANYPFGLFAVPREKLVRLHASSGTTGKPTVVGYTREDVEVWSDLVARSIFAAGGRPGDIVHNAYGYGLFTGGLGAHYGAERLGCTVVPMSGGQTDKQLQLIDDFKPDVIMVTPSYMLTLIDAMEQSGTDPKETSLKVGIFGAEPWTEAIRTEIESRTALDAIDIFGLSEVMGPGVANECIESKDGPVIWEDHFYPEIIDPDTGVVLPDGEPGELVITTLTKEALPVIRYRTRDLTRLLPPTARSMRRIGKITGRSDDMLIIRGVNVFPTQIEEIVCATPGLSAHYIITIDKVAHLDQLRIQVEMRAPGDVNGSPALGDAVARKIKTLIGVSATVEVLAPQTIERVVMGKAKRVFDRR
ncbi:MAG: phenylacetate--CoA ligase PaaK [Gammaproteobacteria bacterium]